MESVLEQARYRGDLESLAALQSDDTLAGLLDRVRGHVGHYNARRYLLADAVRIDPNVLPDLHHALDDVASRAHLELPLEAYVHAGSEINAAVTTSRDRIIVILSSGAVERLASDELDFVIGHELGHAIFKHLEVPVRTVLETQGIEVKQKQAMQMLHWHRCAEVSADRAGLVCCGSLESAARTMFKVLSGLNLDQLRIEPHELAEQWTDLADEVRNNPKGDHWLAPHPFPPLRMKALIAFWGSETAKSLIPNAAGGASDDEADRSIDRWLSLMNPLAREVSVASGNADPLLIGFVLWAALHVCSTNEETKPHRIARLEAMIGSDSVDRALRDVPAHGYRERFQLARSERARPLSALELHRIFSSIAQILKADGTVHPDEIRAMKELALECRVQENVIDKLL